MTVTLEPGRYAAEWFGVEGRGTLPADDVSVDRTGPVSVDPPFDAEPSVLYLRST